MFTSRQTPMTGSYLLGMMLVFDACGARNTTPATQMGAATATPTALVVSHREAERMVGMPAAASAGKTVTDASINGPHGYAFSADSTAIRVGAPSSGPTAPA
jgi:hypothetical protein